MNQNKRGFQHDTDVLIRQVDAHLATLRLGSGVDLALAERVAASLRQLVRGTTRSSAADRARVRAAVHYFLLRRDRRRRRWSTRSLAKDLRIVNLTALALGREDLVIASIRSS